MALIPMACFMRKNVAAKYIRGFVLINRWQLPHICRGLLLSVDKSSSLDTVI